MTRPIGCDNSPFESKAAKYDAWFEEEGNLIFPIEVKTLRYVVTSLPQPWLEIGVGSGRFAQALGIQTGIDPSANLLEMAKIRGITVFRARGEEQFFNKNTFGAIFLILTLCFVNSPLKVLCEAYRVLKPEGKIVLGMVLRENQWGRLYQVKKQEGHLFYQNATFYSYLEVNSLLTESGFTIEKVVSSLFQKPDEVKEIEAPRAGFFSNAGFTVIVAGKVLHIDDKHNEN